PDLRCTHRGSARGATVTGVGAAAGHGVDVLGGHRLPVERPGPGRDHPDPAAAIGDHEVAGVIHGDPARSHRGPGRRAAVPERSTDPDPGGRGQEPGAADLPHRAAVARSPGRTGRLRCPAWCLDVIISALFYPLASFDTSCHGLPSLYYDGARAPEDYSSGAILVFWPPSFEPKHVIIQPQGRGRGL